MEVCLFLLTLVIVLSGADATGSCREANMCCDGRDGSCVVTDLNSVHGGRPCYCDQACLKVGDCCADFQAVCGVTDCEVSVWGPWSECSVACGTGSMTRERRVVRSPSNGGQLCPDLSQKRSCYGSHCNGKAHVMASRETAMILPATYSTIRQLNASEDIRQNLRLRYRKDPEEAVSKEYCVTFQITKLRKACENLDESQKLAVGNKVCTACETAAMRKHLSYQCQGHGDDQRTTRFTFLAFPLCHGRWQRMGTDEKCGGKPDFIFV